MFRRILVASDLSEASRPALRMAYALGAEMGASVVAIHVMDEDPELMDVTPHFGGAHALGTSARPGAARPGRREEAATRQRLERQTRNEIPGGRNPATEAIVRAGPVAETIVATAEAGEVDLIVIGAGTRPGVLGSTAAQVVRMAARPVLAVPAEGSEHDEERDKEADRDLHDEGRAHDRGEPDALRRA